jgi:hypothetical protein
MKETYLTGGSEKNLSRQKHVQGSVYSWDAVDKQAYGKEAPALLPLRSKLRASLAPPRLLRAAPPY